MSDYIGYTTIGDTAVSTIRLPAAYKYSVAETVVFRGPLSGRSRRYESIRDAEAGHADLVAAVREAQR